MSTAVFVCGFAFVFTSVDVLCVSVVVFAVMVLDVLASSVFKVVFEFEFSHLFLGVSAVAIVFAKLSPAQAQLD